MLKQVIEMAPTYEPNLKTMMIDAFVWRPGVSSDKVLVTSFAMTRAIIVENIANQIKGLEAFDAMVAELASQGNKVVPMTKRSKE